MPEFVVFAGCICKQIIVGALLGHCAIVKHGDFVAEFAGGQAVADIDSRLISGDVIELTADLRFRNGVKGCGGFVQNDEGCILIQRMGQ